MSKVRSNIIYSTLYRIINSILPILTIPIVSRTLEPEGLGQYSYAHAIAECFAIFIILGLQNFGNRKIAQCRDNKHELESAFWHLYVNQIICSVITIITYISFILISGGQYSSLFWVNLIHLFAIALDINWLFFGLEKFKFITIRNLIIKSITFITIIIFVKAPSDTILYATIMASSVLASNLSLWFYVFKNIKPCRINRKLSKNLFRGNLFLFIPVVAISIYNIMDKVMLGFLSNPEQVAYYENSERIMNLPMNIFTSIGIAMLPVISNLVSNNKREKSEQYVKKAFDASMLMAIPISICLILVAKPLVCFYLGESFEQSALLVQLLSTVIPIKLWSDITRTQILLPQENDKPYVIATIIGCIINFVVNLLLIGRLDAVGAVIGTILTEIAVCVTQSLFAHKNINLLKILRHSIFYLISSIVIPISYYLLMPLGDSLISSLVRLIPGIITYSALNYHEIVKLLQTAALKWKRKTIPNVNDNP